MKINVNFNKDKTEAQIEASLGFTNKRLDPGGVVIVNSDKVVDAFHQQYPTLVIKEVVSGPSKIHNCDHDASHGVWKVKLNNKVKKATKKSIPARKTKAAN